MFKITIKSQKQGEFWLTKETMEEIEAYRVWAAESAHWGKPAWTEQIEATENQAAYQIIHPAEYELIVEDISAEIAAEQAQIDAIKAAQTQAGLRLQSFPAQVDACQDLEALKVAIKQFVQDVAVLLL